MASDETLNETSLRQYVVEGEDITLNCDLFGYPEPNYTWFIGISPFDPDFSDDSSFEPYNKCAGLKPCIIANVLGMV